MLRKLHDLKGFTVQGKDDKLGKVDDFYFDHDQFIVRYLVLDTGNWLTHDINLISTHDVVNIDVDEKEIKVNLSREDLTNSPNIDKNKPISQVKEEELVEFFGWPDYWTHDHTSESNLIHADTRMRKKLLDYKINKDKEKARESEKEVATNLRSMEKIKNYKIHAEHENIGHLEDIFVDEESWIIRYLLVKTKNVLSGEPVLITPEWIESISWEEGEIFVDKGKEEIKESPRYEPEKADEYIDRSYEEILYDHYNEDKYWKK